MKRLTKLLPVKRKIKRLRQTRLSVFSAIFAVLFIASLLQLNSLGHGIISDLAPAKPKMSPIPTSTTQVQAATDVAFVPERIVIPSAGIDLPVVSVPLKNGTWEVNEGVANFAQGTSLVNNTKGNVGIFGHDKANAFHDIKKILTGYDIMVFGNNYRAIYHVTSASVVAPTAVNVFYPTDKPTLTLITCEGAFSEKRYTLKAELASIEKLQ